MGRDKALLPVDGCTLIEQIASHVRSVAHTVTLIGHADRYRLLGYPVIADRVEGCGPLGGLYTALTVTQAEWNLIVACDMPGVTADLFEDLFRAAEATHADCVIPETCAGLDPLCAVYHQRCLSAVSASITRKVLKMHDFVATIRAERWLVSDPARLFNANTPEEWANR